MSTNTSFTQSAPWIPPDISYVRYQNCEVVADWVLSYFLNVKDLPYRLTARVVRDGFREYWKDNLNRTIKSLPTEAEIVQWAYNSHDTPKLLIQAFSYANNQCREEFCKKLPWEGNQDLAGRGMIANYSIQAIFVTVYMAFHMAARFGWKPPRRTAAQRILVAIQESTRPFLDSTLLFCIAVHIATLFTFIRGHALNKPTPTTAGVTGAFISIYTIFPPLVLHSCAADHLRRKHGRRYIWSFLGALSLVMTGLYFSDPGSAWIRDWLNWSDVTRRLNTAGGDEEDEELRHLLFEDPDHQLKWESFCVTKLGAHRANWAFTIVLGIVFITTVITMVLLANVFRIPFLKSERRSWLRTVRRYKWIMSAFLSLQAMWVSLGIFFWFRFELNKNTGDSNKDQEWTFGQVLAVATWAPVLMEFYVLWRDGAAKGLTGLLSDRFVVVDTTEVEPTPPKAENAMDSHPSDSEDQPDDRNTYAEPSDQDEQSEGFMQRSRTFDQNEDRETEPGRAQTVP